MYTYRISEPKQREGVLGSSKTEHQLYVWIPGKVPLNVREDEQRGELGRRHAKWCQGSCSTQRYFKRNTGVRMLFLGGRKKYRSFTVQAGTISWEFFRLKSIYLVRVGEEPFARNLQPPGERVLLRVFVFKTRLDT